MDLTPVHKAFAEMAMDQLSKNTPETTLRSIVDHIRDCGPLDEDQAKKALVLTLQELGIEANLFAPPDSKDPRWEFVLIDVHYEGETCDIFQADEFGEVVVEGGVEVKLVENIPYSHAEDKAVSMGTKSYNITIDY